jgi:hypothetical protein
MHDLLPLYASFSEGLRVYGSFAEWENAERIRLGLPPRAEASAVPDVQAPQLPSAETPIVLPRLKRQQKRRRRPESIPFTDVTPAMLRAEGICEIGRAQGTSVLFVLTRVKLHLFHTTWLPDRQLDDYAVTLAMSWIENCGLSSGEVAGNLGVNEVTLRQAFLAAGYERAAPMVRRSSTTRVNRRGRFMQRSATQVDSNATTG